MSIYLIIYFLVIANLLLIGFKYFKKNGKFLYGKYFLLSMLFYSIWLFLYVISFSTTYNKDILLIFSRLLYGLSFLSIYTILLFIINYGNKKNSFFDGKFNKIFIIFLITFFSSTIFSNLIIQDMVYNNELKYHYEQLGKFYHIYTFLSFIYFPLFLWFGIKKIFVLHNINKIRFIYIFLGFLFLLFNLILFLAILPFFGIWILQKEQILFFIPFILIIFYSIHRYHFLDIKIIIGKIFIFLLSIFYSIFFVNIFKYYFLNIDNRLINFWGISNDFGTIDLLFGIVLFILGFNFLNNKFLANNQIDKFKSKLSNLSGRISFIMNLEDLNIFLLNEFQYLFKIKYVFIKLFSNEDEYLELYKYFNGNLRGDLFINDIVFIEENKYKFNIKLLREQINEKSYLIFPLINNKRELIGIFEVGYKSFKDQYYTEEIDIIKNFVGYIVGHLKYLNIYSDINDLNINLDKKVDEKTIEYNTLLNRQREFISMSSHEIKTPVASSIFQIDCLIDEFKEAKHSSSYFKKQLDILNEQLLKLGNLVNKIFTVEEYDIKEIKLFIEKINLYILIIDETDRFKKVNKKLKLNLEIDKNIGYIEIDKVQFTQVIDNLLNNALKFSDNKYPIINIKCYLEGKYIVIKIEDNGKGFKDIDINNIFGKYTTGTLSTVGIGLGLYLCKKIISMHNGIIKAKNSRKLGGACFILKIPVIHI